MEDIAILQGFMQTVFPLSDTDWEAFADIWQPYSAKRKELLTLAGERERYLYFVLDGVQRVYYTDVQDREATLVFTYAPSFGNVLDAFLLQQSARYSYETLTPSRFLRTSYPALSALFADHPALEQFIRVAMAHAFSGILTRLTEMQCFSAEERFRELLRRSPHILQIVPHKYLANYLGMDATNFSKFMNRVKL